MTLPSTTLLQHKSSKTSLHKSKSNGMRDRLQSADILRNTAFDCFAFHEDSKGRTKRAHMLHGIILFVYVLAFVASRLCVSFILHPLVCSQRSGVDDMYNKKANFHTLFRRLEVPPPRPPHPLKTHSSVQDFSGPKISQAWTGSFKTPFYPLWPKLVSPGVDLTILGLELPSKTQNLSLVR